MLIEEYLRSQIPVDVPDKTLEAILLDRGIIAGGEVELVPVRDRELALADLKMYASSRPSSQGQRDSDGGWSHQDASYTFTSADRSALRNEARIIYRKYQDSKGGFGIIAEMRRL